MPAAMIAAFSFTVILFVITAYSILGSVPLLVLKHDTPLDSRFVRGFFDNYYRVAVVAAGATAVSYGLAGKLYLAAGATALALLAVLLRRKIIPRMDSLRFAMQAADATAISGFRRIHVTAICVNLAQLVSIVWSLIFVSMH